MFEAINLGNTPVVPEEQYDEYIPPEFRYKRYDMHEAIELVDYYLQDENHQQVPELTRRFNHSTEKMIDVMIEENDL